MKRILKIGLFLLLLFFLLLQFRTQPKIEITSSVPSADFLKTTELSLETAQFLKQACYDCHSVNTKLPWYGKIEPVGGWIRAHVKHGRADLNFSDWDHHPLPDKIEILEVAIKEINKGRMPLPSYLRMHPEARLEKVKELRITDDLQGLLDRYQTQLQ